METAFGPMEYWSLVYINSISNCIRLVINLISLGYLSIIMAIDENHNKLHIGEICQLMAQMVENYTVYNRYCSDVYIQCFLKSMWVTNNPY